MDFSRDEVVEQPTPGEERRLLVPNPAADDTQVGERVRNRLNVSYAGVGLGQGGIHRFAALDQITQQPPLVALAALGRQALNKGFPPTPARAATRSLSRRCYPDYPGRRSSRAPRRSGEKGRRQHLSRAPCSPSAPATQFEPARSCPVSTLRSPPGTRLARCADASS